MNIRNIRKGLFIAGIALASTGWRAHAQATEFLQVTTYERVNSGSIITTGSSRSLMVSVQPDGDPKEITLKEFSLGASKLFGAKKKNVARLRDNDAQVAREMERLAAEGWELYSVVSVWADATAAADVKDGVNTDEKYLITRYLLQRKKK